MTHREKIEQYLREGRTVSGGHHGASGTQKAGQTASFQDQGQQQKLTGQAQDTLSQFEGPVQQSPFYKALYSQGIESTSNAYDRARANMNQRANMAGFGYNQPITQGANSQLDAQEARSLADVPRSAMLSAAGPAMQAAGQTGSMGMGYGQQGLGYYDATAQQDINRQRSGLWNQLWNLPQTAASGFGAYMGAQR